MLRGDSARPDYFQSRFVADQHLGAFGDANNQGVIGIRAKLPQAFFLDLQTLIGSIQRDPQLVRPSGQELLKNRWIGGRLVAQARGQKQIVVREDRQGAVTDAGINLDVQRGAFNRNRSRGYHCRRQRQHRDWCSGMSVGRHGDGRVSYITAAAGRTS